MICCIFIELKILGLSCAHGECDPYPHHHFIHTGNTALSDVSMHKHFIQTICHDIVF